jgi:peptidoglycan/LPS O-acetylase OafA/YrhL
LKELKSLQDCGMASISERDPASKASASLAILHPAPTPFSRSYFPLLDGLRCLSIVAVVWFHATGETHTSGILSRGNEGVSLFFVISGFLITTILLREQSITNDISLNRFYLRRALRIFPLYYAVLAIYVVLVISIEGQSSAGEQFWHNLPYFLTYTSNWFVRLDSDRIIFLFAWSLATEEQFYLVWPWVVKASCGRMLPIATMIVFLVLHYGALIGLANGTLAASWLSTSILISLSPPICFGAIAAFLLHGPTTLPWIEQWIGWRWSAAVALTATVVALAFDSIPDWVVYAAMTWLVAACALRPDDQPLRQMLTNQYVKHVGVVSYGIYLMHVLCINLVRRVTHAHDGFLLFVFALAISIAAASISYRWFESPFLRWKDRLGAGSKTRSNLVGSVLTPPNSILGQRADEVSAPNEHR